MPDWDGGRALAGHADRALTYRVSRTLCPERESPPNPATTGVLNRIIRTHLITVSFPQTRVAPARRIALPTKSKRGVASTVDMLGKLLLSMVIEKSKPSMCQLVHAKIDIFYILLLTVSRRLTDGSAGWLED